MSDIRTVCTKRLRNIADNLSANGYIDSAFEVKHAADVIDELKDLVWDMWDAIPKTESCGWDNTTNCCTGSDECRGECALWHRMREAGIEVMRDE